MLTLFGCVEIMAAIFLFIYVCLFCHKIRAILKVVIGLKQQLGKYMLQFFPFFALVFSNDITLYRYTDLF